jgi:Periplasmic component of the Tol biopolymer transport system
MFRSLLIALSITFAYLATAQEKPKWDVNNPASPLPYRDISFTAEEGTWTCLDVSPDGKTIVFDLLGDIYSMPIGGGTATPLRTGIAWEGQPRFSPDGKKISFTSDAGGGDNIWTMNADGSDAKPVTKETFRLLNNAVWLDNDYLVARKHFTSQRSLGAGELWLYHRSGGEGVQLTKRKNDQQDLNEPSASPDGRYVYFSEDMYGGGFFQYNKNPNTQIFAVRRYDRQNGTVENVTGGSGGACRPQISRNGNWLAFVRRIGIQSVLMVQNMTTGEEFPLYDQLDKDQQEAWTIFGCYPGFSWLPADKGIAIWAGGKIKRLDFDLSKAADWTGSARPKISDIPFRCEVRTKVAETQRPAQKVFEDNFTARAIRQAVTSPDGNWLVFNNIGQLYRKNLPNGKPEKLTNNNNSFEFEPAFSQNGKLIAFVTWDDELLGQIHIWDTDTKSSRALPLPKGIYRTPSFSPDGKSLVFRKQGGDDELGFAHCNKPGIYTVNADGSNLKFVSPNGENPRFWAATEGMRITVTTGGYLFGALDKSLRSYDLDGNNEKILAKRQVHQPMVALPRWAMAGLHRTAQSLRVRHALARPSPRRERRHGLRARFPRQPRRRLQPPLEQRFQKAALHPRRRVFHHRTGKTLRIPSRRTGHLARARHRGHQNRPGTPLLTVPRGL